MNWGEQRAQMDEVLKHPFFGGVGWEALRQMQAPRPPQLTSITDTSYFPTEEYADVPEQPVGVEALDADKDLAFLGYVAAPTHHRPRQCLGAERLVNFPPDSRSSDSPASSRRCEQTPAAAVACGMAFCLFVRFSRACLSLFLCLRPLHFGGLGGGRWFALAVGS
jgi:hypothetical protein